MTYSVKKNCSLYVMFALGFLSAFVQGVTAQSRAFDCISQVTSADAKKIIASVQASYARADGVGMKANFVQESYLASLDVSEVSQGKVFLQKNPTANATSSMRWDYENPEKQTFLLHKQTAYFYQPAEKQLIIDSISSVLLSEVPLAFIMGLGNLDKDFNLVSSCKGSQGVILRLTPTVKKGNSDDQKSADLKELQLLIGSSGNFPSGGRVVDQLGNVTAVVFQQMQFGAASVVDESVYNSNFPTGIDVQDRRKEKDSSKETASEP